jgi:hypothetical protein
MDGWVTMRMIDSKNAGNEKEGTDLSNESLKKLLAFGSYLHLSRALTSLALPFHRPLPQRPCLS